MTVRAKFKLQKIERTTMLRLVEPGSKEYEEVEVQTLHLSPVYANGDPNHENTKFWYYSPSGSIQLGTVNAAAVAQFDLGDEVYVDFTKAE